MISQNHISYTPWVILLFFILGVILVCGVLLGSREVFNPQGAAQAAHSTATFDFLAYQATQGALQATGQSLQAVQERDRLAAVATQIPLEVTVNAAGAQATQDALLIQSSATQGALLIQASATQAALQAQATQTAIQLMASQDQLRFHAQQTSVAVQAEQAEQQGELDRAAQVAVVGIGAVLSIGLVVLMVGITLTILNNSRRKGAAIMAQAIREQRRLIELKAALETRTSPKPLNPLDESGQPARRGGNGTAPHEKMSLVAMNTTVSRYRKPPKVDDLPTVGD
jgi:hypothetical protein